MPTSAATRRLRQKSPAPRVLKKPGRVDAPRYAAVLGGWTLTLGVSTLIPQNDLRWFFLLLHIGMLVVGLGAAVMIEYAGFLWVLGRGTLDEVRMTEGRLSLLSWIGFCGMLVSGMFLAPDLSQPLTLVKLVAVLIVGLNAVNSRSVMRMLKRIPKRRRFQDVPQRVQRWCITSGAISQFAWWTAVVVGTLNTATRGS